MGKGPEDQLRTDRTGGAGGRTSHRPEGGNRLLRLTMVRRGGGTPGKASSGSRVVAASSGQWGVGDGGPLGGGGSERKAGKA
jgi:hypothetical protein